MKLGAKKLASLCFGTMLAMSSIANAAPISPNFTSFGNLTALDGSAVDFGGSGIPTSPAAITEFTTAGGDTVRLGLIATPRFSSPSPTNDGAGTYTVQPGESDPGLSLWNISVYAESSGDLADAGIRFYYDLDPTAGNDLSTLGFVDIPDAALLIPIGSVAEGSVNMGFGFLRNSMGALTAPTPLPGIFDPFAPGEYSFWLGAIDANGQPAEYAAINVNVSPIPLPAGLPLLVGAMGGLLWMRKRQRT